MRPTIESDGELVVLPRRLGYGFLDLEDFEHPEEENDEPHNDNAARFLEARRQKDIVLPVRAQIANIFDGEAALLKGDNWAEYREALDNNPDDPDLVFDISRKLVNLRTPEALTTAKTLIFLPGRNGEIKLRWPEHEELSVLAASILRQDGNMRAMVNILTDEDSQPRFHSNPQARRLLVRGHNALKRFDASKAIVKNTHHKELFRDPMLLVCFVEALLKTQDKDEILRLFSALNAFFRSYATVSLIRPTLQFLHKAREFDLMLYICQQMLIAKPDVKTQERFCDFASRAFNAARKYEVTVDLLLAQSGMNGAHGAQQLTPRFPRNFHCMKNLAYGLIGLGRLRDAEAVVEEAVKNGLPRTEFRHLDERLRGGGGTKPRARTRLNGDRRRRELEL